MQLSSATIDAGTVTIRGTATGALQHRSPTVHMGVDASGAATNTVDVRGGMAT